VRSRGSSVAGGALEALPVGVGMSCGGLAMGDGVVGVVLEAFEAVAEAQVVPRVRGRRRAVCVRVANCPVGGGVVTRLPFNAAQGVSERGVGWLREYLERRPMNLRVLRHRPYTSWRVDDLLVAGRV
jgi:hypothetical protein